jgi:hypothetical protein
MPANPAREGRLLEAILKAERTGGLGIGDAVPRKNRRWTATGKSRCRPVRRLRASIASSHSGGVGAPPGVTTDPCQELADCPEPKCRKKARPDDRKGERRSGAPKGERPSPRAQPPQGGRLPRCASRRSAPLVRFPRGAKGRKGGPGASKNSCHRAAQRWLTKQLAIDRNDEMVYILSLPSCANFSCTRQHSGPS